MLSLITTAKYFTFACSFFLLFPFSLVAQSFWQHNRPLTDLPKELSHLSEARLVQLDTAVWKTALSDIRAAKKTSTKQILSFPDPFGALLAFEVAPTKVMDKQLASKYPHLKTFSGQLPQQSDTEIRFEWNTAGLHAYIHTTENEFLIRPLLEKPGWYIVYDTNQAESTSSLHCGVRHEKNESLDLFKSESSTGDELRIMRFAVATTGEFARRNVTGANTPLEAVVTMTNRLNMITERDLAISFVLVENNDLITFSDPATDPYEENDAYELLDGNTAVLNDLIGVTNFDIGHVLTANITGGVAGVAILGSVCRASKARGVSAFFGNDGNFLSTFAHEVGHQLGASHTWNRCGEDSNDQRSRRSAVEPGSGSTIMSYAGSCGADNVTTSTSNFFHSFNVTQINNLLDDLTCYDIEESDNQPPTVSIPYSNGLYIPQNTPFEMTAIATDPNDDRLTYSWEQVDVGPATAFDEPRGTSPSFRAYPPRSSPTRIVPSFFSQILNTNSRAEVLPNYERRLTFNVIVRDNNRPAGGVDQARFFFRVAENADSFAVVYPNERTDEWEAGSIVEVQWNVGNTDTIPVNCKTVDLLLSYNNGNDGFADTLAHNIPNTGSAFIVVPERLTNRARLKIKASDNIFFDYSNNFFPIVEQVVSTEEVIDDTEILVYPNPTTGELFIQHNFRINKTMQLRLYDVKGALLWQEQRLLGRTDQLDISDYPSGLYFLQIVHQQGTLTKKIRLE
ncbi:MAG: reprolysin-like metallopeptidase [Bacteroidota bacterium]